MSEMQQRRASDGDVIKTPTLNDIYTLLLELKSSHDNIIDAFVLDDLGRPDYTGHRLAHKQQIADMAAMHRYKTGLTKSLLDWGMKGLIAIVLVSLMSSGIGYIKDHIK